MVVFDKKGTNCKLTGFAVNDFGDSRIEEKEKDKIEKYQDLGRELLIIVIIIIIIII